MPRSLTTHIDSPKELGKRLESARKTAGLSQRQLSFPGCTAAYISRLEAGARVPSLQMIQQLALRLGVTTDWLAIGQDVVAAAPDFAIQGSREFRDHSLVVQTSVSFFGAQPEVFMPALESLDLPLGDMLYDAEGPLNALAAWVESFAGEERVEGEREVSTSSDFHLPDVRLEVVSVVTSNCGLPARLATVFAAKLNRLVVQKVSHQLLEFFEEEANCEIARLLDLRDEAARLRREAAELELERVEEARNLLLSS